MQLGSHHVHPKDFYFGMNWEHLVKQEVFLKQADLGETYLDTLFYSTLLLSLNSGPGHPYSLAPSTRKTQHFGTASWPC